MYNHFSRGIGVYVPLFPLVYLLVYAFVDLSVDADATHITLLSGANCIRDKEAGYSFQIIVE